MCSNVNFMAVIGILKKVFVILQIAIPIGLLIFGTIDLGKAVIAGAEKEIKEATGVLIKRIIAAVAVFLLILIVSVVTGWVGGNEWKECWRAADENVRIDPINPVG